jgi:hypothetical protein
MLRVAEKKKKRGEDEEKRKRVSCQECRARRSVAPEREREREMMMVQRHRGARGVVRASTVRWTKRRMSAQVRCRIIERGDVCIVAVAS